MKCSTCGTKVSMMNSIILMNRDSNALLKANKAYHFCKEECLVQFIIKALKGQKIRMLRNKEYWILEL